MEKQNMSVHAGLGELKKIKQRLTNSIENGLYLGCKKKSAEKVSGTDYSNEEFCTRVKADMQSTTDLMKRYGAIKSAIVLSNATTNLSVGTEEMTVAEAIEYKKTIEYKKQLLKILKDKRNNIFSQVALYNERVENNLDNQLISLGVQDKNSSAAKNLENFMEQYRSQNGWDIIDPLKIDDLIAKLEEEILNFETNVDVALSQSNALTYITIEI